MLLPLSPDFDLEEDLLLLLLFDDFSLPSFSRFEEDVDDEVGILKSLNRRAMVVEQDYWI